MKLKYNFVVNEVAGNMVAVAVGDDVTKFNGFIKMNRKGAEIFERLKTETTVDTVVEEMAKLYPESDVNEIKQSVESLVAKLKTAEVLE
ncbi:MAG: PqqD family protein [Acutalibacteraceae bacterium]|nr:PqqD family protein [Acutalibacteraceae bacterium]